jgi:hypothetical protein
VVVSPNCGICGTAEWLQWDGHNSSTTR